MAELSAELLAHLHAFDQTHVVQGFDRLTPIERIRFEAELRDLNLAELRHLHSQRAQKNELPALDRIASLPRQQPTPAQKLAYQRRAESAFRAGEVAFLVVAGGQGSRLGFEQPKGMYPIGPVSHKSLFQIHAEKILALRRRHGRPLPLLVMTSPATDAETRRYFAEKRYFGLPDKEVLFFRQGTMPALDLATGKLLLEAPGRLFLSPNGHGGTLTGLADSGLLDRLQQMGIHTLAYFQVDNPLTNLADPLFLGQHLAQEAEVSTKVLPKTGPLEKVGNVVLVEGRCSIIEYSDLPESWAHQTDEEGRLRFWAGNPAIHLFDLGFLRRITQDAKRIPWHIARKKVAHFDVEQGHLTPTSENALKFERFIFDVLPQAERWTILETDRMQEFAPVKNADGVDSPRTARQMIMNQARGWLRQVGHEVDVEIPIEISPLFALDPDELATKIKELPKIQQPTYLE